MTNKKTPQDKTEYQQNVLNNKKEPHPEQQELVEGIGCKKPTNSKQQAVVKRLKSIDSARQRIKDYFEGKEIPLDQIFEDITESQKTGMKKQIWKASDTNSRKISVQEIVNQIKLLQKKEGWIEGKMSLHRFQAMKPPVKCNDLPKRIPEINAKWRQLKEPYIFVDGSILDCGTAQYFKILLL